MNGYLIDTNVLAEYNRPSGPNLGVRRWLETTDRPSQYVSVVALAEIQKGIELLADGRRRTQLGAIAGVNRWCNRWCQSLRQGTKSERPVPF